MNDSRDERLARAKKLNDRAFVIAVFGLFLPFIGIVCGILAIVLALIARREAKDLDSSVDRNSLTFGVVVTVVWTVGWLMITLPALLTSS